jgi:glutamate--cysteine ligase
VLELARASLAIAKAGLARRAIRDRQGSGDESRFLEPVEAILRHGSAPAQEMLARYEGPWQRSVAPLYAEYAF